MGVRDPTSTFGTTIRFDWLGFFFKMLFLLGLPSRFDCSDHRAGREARDGLLLMLASTIGMCLMASAGDLVMLYLAIESTSIPLHTFCQAMVNDDRSTEAGFKYLLYGATTSAIMLYGFSLLFGFAGTTDLYALAAGLRSSGLPLAAILGVILMIIVGIGFKVSMVPLHFWAPDVYEGAPTPIAGFLSTASKAAGFAVLARLFIVAFPDALAATAINWTAILAVLSAVTMTLGNLLTLRSGTPSAFWHTRRSPPVAMIGIVAATHLGVQVWRSTLAYIVTNLAAFGVVMAVGRIRARMITSVSGLSRRSPALALCMLAAFLSLAGMPPFAGFVGKVLVFAAGVQANYTWLVVVGIINSVIGVYYYLNVMKYVYLFRMEGNDEDKNPIALPRPYALALVVLSVAIIVVGTVVAPWFSQADLAAATLF
jgi:NADH-quinone oxidoreductase subunit N